VLLLALAGAQGYVSFRAQYLFVHQIKGEVAASMLEAAGLDAAAVIFALLALAQARLGRPAATERILNLACVSGSLAMNAASATLSDPKSVAAWVLPALLYAAASDRLIAVVRRQALARTRHTRTRPGTDRSAYTALGRAALWLVRLVLAPASTIIGFRRWVLTTAPTAPAAPGLPRSEPRTGPHVPHTPTRRRAQPGGDEAGEAAEVSGLDTPAAAAPAGRGPRSASLPGASSPRSARDRSHPPNGSSPPGPTAAPPPDPAPDPAPAASPGMAPPSTLNGAANGSPLEVQARTRAVSDDRGNGRSGASKRAVLVGLYDAAGAAGDPRHNTREGVGPMAKQLHHKAGLAQASTARNYLHDLLDQRGIPHRGTAHGSGTADATRTATGTGTSSGSATGTGRTRPELGSGPAPGNGAAAASTDPGGNGLARKGGRSL
jgi:hypothetical protein